MAAASRASRPRTSTASVHSTSSAASHTRSLIDTLQQRKLALERELSETDRLLRGARLGGDRSTPTPPASRSGAIASAGKHAISARPRSRLSRPGEAAAPPDATRPAGEAASRPGASTGSPRPRAVGDDAGDDEDGAGSVFSRVSGSATSLTTTTAYTEHSVPASAMVPKCYAAVGYKSLTKAQLQNLQYPLLKHAHAVRAIKHQLHTLGDKVSEGYGAMLQQDLSEQRARRRKAGDFARYLDHSIRANVNLKASGHQ